MTLEQTVVELNRLGISSTVLESGVDGALLCLPEYGRVLGLWPHWRGENALWVNPDFLRMLQIGSKDDEWLNPGGDRMWLAPESEFFPGGAVAPAIDPGKYVRIAEKGLFAMENRGEAHAWKSDLRMRFRIVRRIRPLAEGEIPESWGTQWLRRTGYTEEAMLEVSGEAPAGARLWNLTQVRAGAEVRVPSRGSAAAQARITCIEEGETGRGHLVVKEFPTAAESDDGDPLIGCRFPPGQGSGELFCASPSVDARERRRVTWKTALYAFSGRIEELRAAAVRIAR